MQNDILDSIKSIESYKSLKSIAICCQESFLSPGFGHDVVLVQNTWRQLTSKKLIFLWVVEMNWILFYWFDWLDDWLHWGHLSLWIVMLVWWLKNQVCLLLVCIDSVLQEGIALQELSFLLLEFSIFCLKFLYSDQRLFHHLLLEFIVFFELEQFADLCLNLLRINAGRFLWEQCSIPSFRWSQRFE